MLKNYIRIALRHLRSNRVSSVINIAGLAIGMTVAMLIGLWIHDELSFNKNFDRYDRVGKIWQFVTFEKGSKVPYDVMPAPMAAELRSNYPDFKRVSLTSWTQNTVVANGDKKLSQQGLFAEPDFTEIFSLKMLEGSRDGLKDERTVMLDASTAKALFGDLDPLGRVLTLSDTVPVKVTGVYEDFPENSTLNGMHFLSPWSLWEANDGSVRESMSNWANNSFAVYVELKDGVDFQKASGKIRNILLSRKEHPVYGPEFFVFPMRRWHLYLDFQNGVNVGGFISVVRLFGIIGIFVLLLACINFMNLSTARSEKRAREVGIRKTIGSVRRQLVAQFFIESLMVAFFAWGLALLLVWMALPLFNGLSGKHMSIPWGDPMIWAAGLGFSLVTGLIAGSYPALYLSSFQPVKVLKGPFRSGRYASLPRKVLVVLQFTVSVALIIGTTVVYRQVQYAKDRSLGYSPQGLIETYVKNPSLLKHFSALRTDLLSTGAVYEVAVASSSATGQDGGTTNVNWKGKDPNDHPLFMSNAVTHEYGKTLGWRVTRGRDFNRAFGSDSSGIILNEAAAKFIRLAHPLGAPIQYDGHTYQVIGVISDMIRESPFLPVKPSFYTLGHYMLHMEIKLSPALSVHEALHRVENVFAKYDPENPFSYTFVNTDFAAKFNSEERIGKLATFFALLAILISCLGLFGLASFMAEQRTKEIGIRKVLGASMVQLWQLLSTEFMLLVGLSFVIASPLAYYYMQGWLMQYEYRTTVAWWIFAAAGAGTVLITLATVSFQAIKAALANPARSLRSE